MIDGFPGSGNSFAVAYFKACQRTPVRCAHHLHSPAQIIKATTLNLPVLLTIRDPQAAVLSMTSRWVYMHPRQCLRAYAKFYETIEPLHEHFILGPFEEVVSHPETIFRRLNNVFGVTFDTIKTDDPDLESQFITEQNLSEQELVTHRKTRATKKQLLRELENDKWSLRAESIYQRLMSL